MSAVEFVGSLKEAKDTTYTYIKTDKNGTQYYTASSKCYLCKGTGYVDYFKYYANGTCFPCHGTGYEHYPVKVYTEDYWKKLEEARARRAEKILAERAAKEVERAEKALNTCMKTHNRECETCKYRGFCTILNGAKITFENLENKTDFQNRIINISTPKEKPEIVTLEGEPCKVSGWFENSFGGSSRCITKPDGTTVFTSAITNKGLSKYGLKKYEEEE